MEHKHKDMYKLIIKGNFNKLCPTPFEGNYVAILREPPSIFLFYKRKMWGIATC